MTPHPQFGPGYRVPAEPTGEILDRAASIARFEADMAAYRAREKAARAYWRAHPDRSLGPVTWPVLEFKRGWNKAYYEGGYRMVIGGEPIRVAAHVASWSARARAMLGGGTAGSKETEKLGKQMDKLFPFRRRPATCTYCRQEYSTKLDDEPPCYRQHLVEMAQQEAPNYAVAAE